MWAHLRDPWDLDYLIPCARVGSAPFATEELVVYPTRLATWASFPHAGDVVPLYQLEIPLQCASEDESACNDGGEESDLKFEMGCGWYSLGRPACSQVSFLTNATTTEEVKGRGGGGTKCQRTAPEDITRN